MADEITVQLSLAYSSGEASIDFNLGVLKGDQSSFGGLKATQNVGTSEETLNVGDVTNEGVVLMWNLDDTNFVEVGVATGVYFGELQPQKLPMLIPLKSGQTVYLKADTAACEIQYVLLEY